MSDEYEVNVTVSDLIPFTCDTYDETNPTDLKTNPFQEG